MLYVSFVEIFVKSLDGFADSSAFGDSDAYLMTTAALFGGMGFMSGLDALVHWLDPNRSAHHASDPRKHMADPAPDLAPCCELDDGVFDEIERRRAAAAAGAPDQPDEPPKADDTTKDKRLESMGMMTALAIGIHNFPEGLCVSIPIYFATGDRWKAFRWALLSGVSEPVGALLGWLLLKDHFNE